MNAFLRLNQRIWNLLTTFGPIASYGNFLQNLVRLGGAPYVLKTASVAAFTGKGLKGYAFDGLRSGQLEICFIEVEKGHDTFMISKRITRIYYILEGKGYFTIENEKYDVEPGMLVEVPPKVEYSYSGTMRLLLISKPRWFEGNDKHTRINPDVC